MMRMRRFLTALALLTAACSGQGSALAPSSTAPDPTPSTTSTTIGFPDEIVDAPETRPLFRGFTTETIPDTMTLVARAEGEVAVFDSPDAPEPFVIVPAQTILGTTTVFAVVQGPIEGWAEVMLPVRPNDVTGWVDTSELSLYVVDGKLVVDLSERSLTYFEDGEEVVETTVAIGTDRNPTPTGSFYVTDNVTLADPNSPWGPHAFGLSARSDTITEYNGGDGIIGIHGTNRPSSIGQAASLGCIRLPNDVITRLHELVAIGTPVEIVA
jgi:lipoprotein-anchoring transpeptidase ErfK/SrfK